MLFTASSALEQKAPPGPVASLSDSCHSSNSWSTEAGPQQRTEPGISLSASIHSSPGGEVLFPHFTDGETEAQRSLETKPQHNYY